MPSIFDWSATPNSNSSVGGVNIAEGMSPALVNDALRMALSIIVQTFASALQNFLNGTAALPIANGGTGAASAGAALTALGGLSAGFRDLQVINKNAAFTMADSERGCGINYFGAAAVATINQNATTAITVGAVYVLRNNGTGALTITPSGTATLKKNGATSSSSAVLGIGGVASLVQWNADDWTVTGSGIS